MLKVFVVILNWNGKEDTIECLKSIQELRIMNYELRIIVVDNGSTDESVEKIKNQKSKIKNLHLIENKENLGFAGGNNVGIGYALENGADFVLVLNNDTRVKQDLIVRLLEAVDKYKDVGIFSPKIYFAKGYEFHKERY